MNTTKNKLSFGTKQVMFYGIYFLCFLVFLEILRMLMAGPKYIPISENMLAELETISSIRTAVVTKDRPGGRNPITFLEVEGRPYKFHYDGFVLKGDNTILGKNLTAYFYDNKLISMYLNGRIVYKQHPDNDLPESKQ